MRRHYLCGVGFRFAAGLVLTLSLVSCSEVFPKRSPGENVYRKHCSECHGVDGAGETIRSMGRDKTNLLDESWRYAMGESGIETVLSQDLVFDHPTFSERLTPQEIKEVGRYVRTLRSRQ